MSLSIKTLKIAAILFSLLILFSLNFNIVLAKNDRSKVNEINIQIRNLSELRKQAESRKKSLSAEVDRIDLKIDSIENQISDLDTQISRVNEAKSRTALEIAEVRNELVKRVEEYEVAQARLDLQVSILQDRASAIYMNDGFSSLAIFATFLARASGFDDLVARFNLVNYVMRGDLRILSEVESARKVAEIKRRSVESRKKKVENLARLFENQRISLFTLRNSEAEHRKRVEGEKDLKQGLLATAERDRARYREREKELRAESRRIEAELAAQQSNSPSQITGSMLWPVRGEITSYFGWRIHPINGQRQYHTGIDIAAATGTNIVASASGTVIYSGYRGGYGNTIIIDHGGKIATLYAHQQELLVSSGAKVTAGQVIGKVDSTGFSTGPHLHFEVRVNGVPTNPLEGYLK